MFASASQLSASARTRIASNRVASTSYDGRTISRRTRTLRVTNAADDFRNVKIEKLARSARSVVGAGDNGSIVLRQV